MRLALLLLLAVSTTAPAYAETPSDGLVQIETEEGPVVFAVEIADEPNERSRGLMHRDALDDGAGMLFIYPTPRIASFWMKNTRIPLDMIFIDAEGEIASIAREAVPFSLEPRRSTLPVTMVLEIDGGDADRLGIEIGDTMTWELNEPSE